MGEVSNWPDVDPEGRARSFCEFVWAMEYGFLRGEDVGRAAMRKEMLALSTEFFRLLVQQRFPGVRFDKQLAAVNDPNILRQLAHELANISEAKTLRQRLRELTAAQASAD